jgi:hypothetical protein
MVKDEQQAHDSAQQQASRRNSGESTEAGDAQPEKERSYTTEESPRRVPLEEFLLSDVYNVVRFSLSMFMQQAWVSLGLLAVPGTSETRQDLQQARIAIDVAGFLLSKLKEQASNEEMENLERELTNLRLNYARKAG